MNKEITRKELAKRWNCNKATLVYRQNNGTLKGRRIGTTYYYSMEEILRIEAKNPISKKRQNVGIKAWYSLNGVKVRIVKFIARLLK
jgi:hypothetical protein